MKLFKEVSDRIAAELERGEVPVWLKPWKVSVNNGGSIMPRNYVTGKGYRGVNVPILWGMASAMGYAVPGWLTFNQARAAGASVRKGEKATQIVFTKS